MARTEKKDETPDYELVQLEFLARSGLSPWGAAAPSVAAAHHLFTELGKLELGTRVKNLMSALRQKITRRRTVTLATTPQRYALATTTLRHTLATTPQRYGVDLPLQAEACEAMMDEVRRFQWLEAERAGRDIWREANPIDPESVAFQVWFRQYFGA